RRTHVGVLERQRHGRRLGVGFIRRQRREQRTAAGTVVGNCLLAVVRAGQRDEPDLLVEPGGPRELISRSRLGRELRNPRLSPGRRPPGPSWTRSRDSVPGDDEVLKLWRDPLLLGPAYLLLGIRRASRAGRRTRGALGR